MQFDEFMGQVQQRCQLPDTDAALRATRATLTALARRIPPAARENLGAQLPGELEHLVAEAGDGPERFDAQGFIQRVSEREGTELPDATYHARVVLEVLGEAVGPDVIGKVQQLLPEDYAPLLTSGSGGQMPRPS